MQLPDGQIVVPPTCPEVLATAEFATDIMEAYRERLRQGSAALDIRIGVAVMGLYVEIADAKPNRPSSLLTLEAWVAFYGNDDRANPFLEAGTIVEPVGSPLALWLREHSRKLSNDPAFPGLRRLHAIVCGRVAGCRGVVDGECWALGRRGFRAAVEQAFDERTEDS